MAHSWACAIKVLQPIWWKKKWEKWLLYGWPMIKWCISTRQPFLTQPCYQLLEKDNPTALGSASIFSGRDQKKAQWGLRGAQPTPPTMTWHHQQGGRHRLLGCKSHWMSTPWTRTGDPTALPQKTEWRQSGLPLCPAEGEANVSKCRLDI